MLKHKRHSLHVEAMGRSVKAKRKQRRKQKQQKRGVKRLNRMGDHCKPQEGDATPGHGPPRVLTELEPTQSQSPKRATTESDLDFSAGNNSSDIYPTSTQESCSSSNFGRAFGQKPVFPECNSREVEPLQAGLIQMNAASDVSHTVEGISHLSSRKQCSKLVEELSKKTEALYFYVHKTEQQKRDIKMMRHECKERIEGIRTFWQDKIYNEHSRGGKLIKRACSIK